jgi:pilus assembly protein Flp/PilA
VLPLKGTTSTPDVVPFSTNSQERFMSEPRDDGASAVEYGLIVAAICAVLIVVVFTLGRSTASTYDDTCQRWADESGTACE